MDGMFGRTLLAIVLAALLFLTGMANAIDLNVNSTFSISPGFFCDSLGLCL